MKTILSLIFLGMFSMSTSAAPSKHPEGLQKLVNQLQNDPQVKWGFDFAKKQRFIEPDARFSDWYVGYPIELFGMSGEALEKCADTMGILKFLVPANEWIIPVRVKDRYIFHIEVLYEDSTFRSYGCGEGVIGFDTWNKVREKFPEESGVNPIIIDGQTKTLYFPGQKNRKSMFYVRPKWTDTLCKITSPSLDNLDDESLFIKYWKGTWPEVKAHNREFDQKYPGLFKDGKEGDNEATK